MRSLWIVLAASGLALCAIATSNFALADEANEANESEENEKIISLNDVPAPARDTIVREAKGATITKVEQETRNCAMVYEAHVRSAGGEVGIVVDPNGKLLERHSEKNEQ